MHRSTVMHYQLLGSFKKCFHTQNANILCRYYSTHYQLIIHSYVNFEIEVANSFCNKRRRFIVYVTAHILKQKSLATHHRYAYLLQKSTLNNTNLIRCFCRNAITIFSNTEDGKISFLWSAVPVIKCFS